MDINQVIKAYLGRAPSLVNENANQGFSMSGLKTTIAEHVLKEDLLSKSPAAAFHRTGALHLHDSGGGEFAAYCHGGDLLNLLMTGIDNPAGTSSDPAKHFDVAVDHIVNYMYTIQNEWEGAQALSFHPNTPVTIRRNGHIESYAMEELYNVYGHTPYYTPSQDVILPPFTSGCSMKDIRVKNSRIAAMDQKFIFQTDTIEILDETGFVPIHAISRHPNNRPDADTLVKIQTESGRVIIVTKAHTVITSSGGKPARDIKIGDELVNTDVAEVVGGNISIDSDFMWLVGMMIAEGGNYGHQIHISQKDTSSITSRLDKLGIDWTEYQKRGSLGTMCGDVVISSTSFGRLVTEFFGLRKYAWNKNLPTIYPNLTQESLFALISGYIDGDGSVSHYEAKASSLRITSTSYTLLSQIQSVFESIGIVATMRCAKPCSGANVPSKHDVYVLRCRIGAECSHYFQHCEKMKEFRWKVRQSYPKTDHVELVDECLWQSDYVYDITTSSGTFVINGLIVHNSSFDTLLAPFVRADNLTQRQVEQSIQRMVYNLSYPLRAAMQTPFTNLSFDLVCPGHMKDEPAIIGGLPTEDKLSDFQNEMAMINIAFCDVMLQGDRDGNPHTFPIPTYGITKEFDWDSKVANKIFYVAAKFGLPYFMNYIGSGMDPSSNRAMCCRLQMDLNEIIEKTKGGLWNTGVNTGSLSVVTINLPQLGYIARTMSRASDGAQTVDSTAFADMHSIFFSRLNTLLDAARRHNVWKRERINVGFELGLMPFTKSYLKNFEKFFSTIGVIGMNECCLNMFGKPVWQCENFVESVLSHIHGYVRDLTKEYGYPWNFEETPAEGCSHSLAVRDKQVYPDIITQGEGDGVFYTNSSHIYVGDELSLGDSLNIQQKFKSYYNGGTLFHIFCGESNPDRDGLKDLIKNICTNTTIPYLALTRAYSVCPGCGVSSDLSGICPDCGAETTVWDRVTGYYRPSTKYNPGKQAEFLARKRFEVG